MKKKAYIQPQTEVIDVMISSPLLSGSTFSTGVDVDLENDIAPEAPSLLFQSPEDILFLP